jgi:hypothetical protein
MLGSSLGDLSFENILTPPDLRTRSELAHGQRRYSPCSRRGRVSNLQVRGYMMINVATNAATIAVTWVEISETIWNQEGTIQNLFQALFSRACRAPNVVSSLHFN